MANEVIKSQKLKNRNMKTLRLKLLNCEKDILIRKESDIKKFLIEFAKINSKSEYIDKMDINELIDYINKMGVLKFSIH